MNRSQFERTGFLTQISIVLFSITTVWVSGPSFYPIEHIVVAEAVSIAPTEATLATEMVPSEPTDADFQQPQIEPMRLFAVSSEFDPIIFSVSREMNVDPALVKAVIHSESAFDQFAVSSQGASGLMQLMPETAERFAINDPFNAEQNIRGGVRFLKHLLFTFENDVRLAIAAYNAGPGRVHYYGDVPPFIETHTYVYKVLELRKLYNERNPRAKDKAGKSTASLETAVST